MGEIRGAQPNPGSGTDSGTPIGPKRALEYGYVLLKPNKKPGKGSISDPNLVLKEHLVSSRGISEIDRSLIGIGIGSDHEPINRTRVFVFDSIRSIDLFMQNRVRHWEIWKCEVFNSKPMKYLAVMAWEGLMSPEDLWELLITNDPKDLDQRDCKVSLAPAGLMVSSGVRLIEKVRDAE